MHASENPAGTYGRAVVCTPPEALHLPVLRTVAPLNPQPFPYALVVLSQKGPNSSTQPSPGTHKNVSLTPPRPYSTPRVPACLPAWRPAGLLPCLHVQCCSAHSKSHNEPA